MDADEPEALTAVPDVAYQMEADTDSFWSLIDSEHEDDAHDEKG